MALAQHWSERRSNSLDSKVVSSSLWLETLAYYSRFGFSADAAKLFRCQYAGPHFVALRLSEGAATDAAPVVYSDAFADLA